MAARITLTVVCAIGAVIAAYVVISMVTGLPMWAVIFVVPALAIAVAAMFLPGPAARRVSRKRAGSKAPKDIVDCVGESLRIGDTVRAGAGFDGPMELTFGRGVVVKVGHGKAHVRFHDIPEQVHPVTPGTLRRLGQPLARPASGAARRVRRKG